MEWEGFQWKRGKHPGQGDGKYWLEGIRGERRREEGGLNEDDVDRV